MKKFLGFLMLMCMTLMMASCNGCNQPQDKLSVDSALIDTISIKNAIDVDHAIATDRQAMYIKFKDNYRWYETDILLPEFLNSENVTSDPEMVVNIFQSIVQKGKGFDTWVFKFQHFADGTVLKDSVQGFWIENNPLNEEVIKLKYIEAFDKIMQTNSPKPQSKHVTLRNPVGPVEVNTQWIFGNIREQLWVDAVTGEVKNSNPAFPEEKGFKMPLGEWP
jgi:hypothetical protein